ncbi:antitoxin Phd [Sanguibacter gelidistatuariae]|uniref:Antitoxin Phd n=1 Tax=Sanguibacter gelidistatuariae TaxID=1814289 RepID=A0A1G6SU10_9MICO|nr:type II toxin-antitoxin system Phd/YefM family antitoxin [Sanguibacter gelidistatuariae]SDD20352.1 antitoxin Phd [Sanguibacter gelidistatuariae]
MLVDTHNLVSLTEANQNFSRVARMVDERGSVVILRNNVPRYVVIDFAQIEDTAASDDEVLAAGAMFIDKHREAFDELAK